MSDIKKTVKKKKTPKVSMEKTPDTARLLAEAADRGIITDDQRAQLEGLRRGTAVDSEEPIRPVSNFNEIFVTFGVLLLLGAAHSLMALLLHAPTFVRVIDAGIDWLVADYFFMRGRFRLPIIMGSLYAAWALSHAVANGYGFSSLQWRNEAVSLQAMLSPLLAGMAVLVAAASRFRVPFLMLPISILFVCIVTIGGRYGAHLDSYRLALGMAGVFILAMAVYFDLKDPKRVTRWSDFAFWSYSAWTNSGEPTM